MESRAALANDFYGGWEPSDVLRFHKYHCPKLGQSGYITDFFGIRTPTECVPWAAGADGTTSTDCPIPDDGIRAEAIEYYALVRALELSSDESFSMIELGASYAPWACLGACLALRANRRRVKVRAVEASQFFIEKLKENWAVNGLSQDSPLYPQQLIECDVMHAAIATEPGSMFFPLVGGFGENGGQAVATAREVDYVGRKVAHEEVRAITVEQAMSGFDTVDLIHCDIQGAERDVLPRAIGLLTDRVRCVFVGTHSREIEGVLLSCFHRAGWSLSRERPAMFLHRPELPEIEGMTTRDGGQFWINSKFN